MTFIIVAKSDDAAADQALWRFGANDCTAPSLRLFMRDDFNSDGLHLQACSATEDQHASLPNENDSAPMVVSAVKMATGIEIYKNGGGMMLENNMTYDAGSFDISAEPQTLAVGYVNGSGVYWKGLIAELLIYRGVLAPTKRNEVELCLMAMYGITP